MHLSLICSILLPTENMRSRHIITISLFLALLFFIGTRIAFFIQIFFKHAGIEITQKEIVDRFAGEGQMDGGIPKILHHVFHNWHEVGNETLREDYRETREKCRGLNERWEFKVWFLYCLVPMRVRVANCG
jgi:inositol phosphorylceramide mannosyltransferase catalytic subunit